MTEDTEITLTHGDWKATAASYGASLRGVTHQNQPVVAGYHGKENKVGGQGDVLIPFPGRVKNGAYDFDGTHYQMAKSDKEGPNAIHGFLRSTIWDIAAHDSDFVTFATRFDGAEGYPFPLHARVNYALTDDGLTCDFAVENVGEKTAPVAAGFHPYFTVGSNSIDGDTLHVPMASYLPTENLVPTGEVASVTETEWDFTSPRQIGATKFNTCYAHPTRDANGRFSVTLAGENRQLTVWLNATFGYVVLYSGDPLPPAHARRALAIEPMTCGADAFNHPDWGLTFLKPGETLTGEWGVTL